MLMPPSRPLEHLLALALARILRDTRPRSRRSGIRRRGQAQHAERALQRREREQQARQPVDRLRDDGAEARVQQARQQRRVQVRGGAGERSRELGYGWEGGEQAVCFWGWYCGLLRGAA